MTTKVIKRDDASFTISAVMPSDWPTVTAGTITVTTLGGTELVSAQAVTIGAADTTAGSISAGEDSTTLVTGGTWVNGEPIRVGSDALSWEHHIVDQYTSGSKTLSVQDFFDHDFASGVAVQHRTMTYALDTDTSTTWDDISEVAVTWTPTADALPFREMYAVLNKKAASSGLEQLFQVSFGRYYEEIQPEHYLDFEDRARHRVSLLFDQGGRDINKLVDNQYLDELIMVQIAILIALSKGDEYDAELIKLKSDFNEQLAIINGLPIWFDDNEDDIKTDEEYQPSIQAGIGRGL